MDTCHTTTPAPVLSLASLQEVLAKDPQRKIKEYSVLDRIEEIFLPTDFSDFTKVAEEATKLDGLEGALKIVHDPYITLYAFDFAGRRAIYVKTDADEDLYTFPFLYLAQQKNAKRLYSVPLELLEKIFFGENSNSKEFVYNQQNTSLKSDDQLLFLFSTGRCGSTLLCKVLDRIEGVLGLQEPEPFTCCCYLRNTGGATDEEVITLIRIAVLAHCKPKLHHPGDVKKWVFKHQSQTSEWMDLFPRAFPKAQNLFMYRNADGVTKSIAKMLPDLDKELIPVEAWTALWTGLKWLPGEKKYMRDMAAVYWLCTMRKVIEFKKSGMKITCVRYEELVAETEKVVRELSKRFNIELKEENVQYVLDALKGHSQEGVFVVHEHKGVENAVATMRKLVKECTEIGTVDYILPETILK